MIDNRNRWSNFGNSDQLYSKYKQTQQPQQPTQVQQQPQQQFGNPWQDLGKNIGKTWRDSLAKRKDGMFNGEKIDRTGFDSKMTDQEILNYNNSIGDMTNNVISKYGADTYGGESVADVINTTAPNSIGTSIGGGTATDSIGMGVADSIGTELSANELATLGAETVGDAAAAEGATVAGAGGAGGASLGAIAGPLAGAALVGADLARGRDNSIIRKNLHHWFGW